MQARLGKVFDIRTVKRLRVVPAVFVLLALLVTGLAACGEGSQPAAQPAEPPAPAPTAQPAAQPTEEPTSSEAAPAQPAVTKAEATSAPQAQALPAGQPEPAPETRAETAPTSTPEPVPASEPESPAPETPAMEAPSPPAETPESADGAGFAVGEGSEATFTVNEKLAWLDLPNDAVMRTTGLSGTIYLDGQPSVIELDLHSMTSDSDRRDGYVRNRMFPDDRTATFTVTSLGDLPHPLPEGEEISREVQGELTIQGVTKPITFQVQARRDPDKLFVLGRTTFTWQELEIPPPNIPGRIQVKDEVQVEALLSAVPAAP
ncbi:MAG: YceI family protein [Chloroflexota bacterium]|nr:YceI family protein [Chloroflexota bacterium]